MLTLSSYSGGSIHSGWCSLLLYWFSISGSVSDIIRESLSVTECLENWHGPSLCRHARGGGGGVLLIRRCCELTIERALISYLLWTLDTQQTSKHSAALAHWSTTQRSAITRRVLSVTKWRHSLRALALRCVLQGAQDNCRVWWSAAKPSSNCAWQEIKQLRIIDYSIFRVNTLDAIWCVWLLRATT